jgi:hypothetical protein
MLFVLDTKLDILIGELGFVKVDYQVFIIKDSALRGVHQLVQDIFLDLNHLDLILHYRF